MTLTQLAEANRVLNGKPEHTPIIWTCGRCGRGIADPKIFINGKPVHIPICLPNKWTR